MELEVHPALQPFAHGAYAHPQDLQQHARTQEGWAGHSLQTARAHKHEGPEWRCTSAGVQNLSSTSYSWHGKN
jgi:hypothetical protein